MMINFIYGDLGYGKTYTVTQMIAKDTENKKSAMLIVPEQQVLATERLLLELLPPSAQLYTEVLSFSRLYNRVCREYGGLEYNYITKPAKYLLMWKTIHQLSPMLEHYKGGGASDGSLTDYFLSSLGEFKASGITPAALERVSENIDKTSLLHAKLRDISLIWSAYNASVSESFSDSSDDVDKLADILKKEDFFKGINVYVDSFTSFTSPEHSVLDRIFATADSTTVTIPLPHSGFSSLYTESISASEDRLISAAKKRGRPNIITLTENKRTSDPALSLLSKNLWELTERALGEEINTDSVKLEVASNPYSEAEAAARWTLELLRMGYRCRDIVVTMRDTESYRGIIEPAFERCVIPFYISEKSDLCSRSAVKFILSALRIKIYGWRAEDVIAHLKTGLYHLPHSSVDMFESYVKKWSIKGNRFFEDNWTMNPDGYTDAISERGIKILQAANEVRELLSSSLIPLFTELDAAENGKEMCLAIYKYINASGLEDRLNELSMRSSANGNVKEAEEYAALYGITVNSLATAAEILEGDDMTTEELEAALRVVFNNTEIGTIPTSVDEVTIGSASMLRANAPKCVLVLGLCEGEFPKSVSESGLLNTPEKDILFEHGVEFSSTSDMRSSDELLFVRRAFALPSERLILLTHLSGSDGREKNPSLAFKRVKELLSLKEHRFLETDLEYLAGTPENAARFIRLMEDPKKAEELRRVLLSFGEEFSYLGDCSEVSLSASDDSVSKALAEEIFKKNMTMSKTKLEKYIECNFSYYCSNVLKLRDEDKADFAGLEIGIFVHHILENLINAVIDGDLLSEDPDSDILEEIANRVTEKYLATVCPEFERKKGRFAHLCKRLKALSLITAKNIIDEFSHSEFLPAFTELKIGNDSSSLPSMDILLEDGGRVFLTGTVDRVDLLKKDGRIFVRVVDYKTGSQSFSLDDLKLGFNTQMLTYLFSLCSERARTFFAGNGIECDAPPLPAGVVYLSSNISMQKLGDYTDPEKVLSMAQDALTRKGVLLADEEILRSMSDNFSPSVLLGAKITKKNGLSGKSLIDMEKFFEIKEQISHAVAAVATDMRSGKASAHPLIHSGKNPCDYCKMRAVCRRTDQNKKSFPEE